MGFCIRIQHNDQIFEPVVTGDVILTQEKNKPSMIEFTIMADDIVTVEVGNTVSVTADTLFPDTGTHFIIFAYVFKIIPKKNGEATITAYDQIRYLLNTDTYTYADKTLTQFLRMVCSDCRIKSGDDIMETFYVIPSRVEDNQSYLDMILAAIKLTKENTGVEYILWDNFGEIALHDVEFLTVPIRIQADTAQDFALAYSIDDDVYNQIKLYREKEDGAREVFIRNDVGNIALWGLLQTCESLNDDENGDAKAASMLAEKNKKKRTISVSGAFGDMRVRGGSRVFVTLDVPLKLGFGINGHASDNYLTVDRVVHNFKAGGFHTMDLELSGGYL